MLDCLELYVATKVDALRERIPDPAYYWNFVSLARNVSPDGQAVRTVGFTALSAGQERRLLLSRPQTQEPEGLTLPVIEGPRKVTIRGTLKFADALKKEHSIIRVVDSEGRAQKVLVPPGMMDDIVRPLWDYEVTIIGLRERGTIVLEDIRRSEGKS